MSAEYRSILHVVGQGSYANGSPYGSPEFATVLEAQGWVKTMTIARKGPRRPQWSASGPREMAQSDYRELVEELSECPERQSNRTGDEHPLRYVMTFYVTMWDGASSSSRVIEHVLAIDGSPWSGIAAELVSLLRDE